MNSQAGFFTTLREELGGRTLLVMLGCLLAQMGLSFGYVFPALAQDILADTGWTRSEFAFARLPQIAAMAAASPFIGSLVFRFGGRKVLAGSVALLGVVFLWLFPRTESLTFYYLFMMATGIGLAGLGDITVGQVVSEWVNRSRGLLLGIVYAGSNLGGLLLVPWMVRISAESDWRNALGIMGLGALLVMLPSVIFLVRDRKRSTPAPENPATPLTPRVESDQDIPLRTALRTRSFWILAFSLFTFFFYFLAMLEHMVLHLTDIGMERGEAVARYALAIGLGIGSKIGLGLVADRINDRYSILIDCGVLAFSSILLLLTPGSLTLWVFVISFGFSYAARDVVYPLIVTYCFGLRYMAPIYGALMVSLFFGAAGPLFAAWVHDHYGSYDLAFGTFAVLNGACLVALFFLRDERQHVSSA
ncbi:MAG: MFS transporter [Myxococcota bacterium]